MSQEPEATPPQEPEPPQVICSAWERCPRKGCGHWKDHRYAEYGNPDGCKPMFCSIIQETVSCVPMESPQPVEEGAKSERGS